MDPNVKPQTMTDEGLSLNSVYEHKDVIDIDGIIIINRVCLSEG